MRWVEGEGGASVRVGRREGLEVKSCIVCEKGVGMDWEWD